MQCLIIAGGLGTRMHAFTQKIPKALIPIEGHPFLKYQLDWLRQNKVANVIICVGDKGQQIRDYAGNGSAWNLSIRYTDEGKNLMGTGGAVRLALDQDYLEPVFAVMYGDSYLPLDVQKVWDSFAKRRESAMMTVFPNQDHWDTSNASFDGQKVTLYSKKPSDKSPEMRYIDYGLSLFRKTTIEREIPQAQRVDLADVLHRLSLRGDLAGYEADQRFFEIGSVQGLADFADYVKGVLHGKPS